MESPIGNEKNLSLTIKGEMTFLKRALQELPLFLEEQRCSVFKKKSRSSYAIGLDEEEIKSLLFNFCVEYYAKSFSIYVVKLESSKTSHVLFARDFKDIPYRTTLCERSAEEWQVVDHVLPAKIRTQRKQDNAYFGWCKICKANFLEFLEAQGFLRYKKEW